MPNLKDIRRRIKSVKSTQKITQAMRMVAAAKVKRAEGRMKAAKPYSDCLFQVCTDVFQNLKHQVSAIEGSRYIEFLKPRSVQNVGLIVISSDRGLCGAYNANIIRRGFQLEQSLIDAGQTPKLYLVGNKAIQAFSRHSQGDILGQSSMSAAPTIENAQHIVEPLVQAYLNGEIDSIQILSTEFRSMISYKASEVTLIPADESMNPNNAKDHPVIPELLLEPDPIQVLDQLIPMYLNQAVYMRLLESVASELAARMTAMSNATNNASDMLDKLTLQYNKARQTAITQELLEVVSGANALA